MTSPSQSAPHASTEGENTDQTATSLFGFQLEPAIERIAHWLPTQSPIKDFIHHNTLHALETRPFHEAIAIASRIYGARSYLPLADYQNRYKSGRIKDFAVEHVLESVEPNPETRRVLRESMFTPNLEAHYPPPSLSHHGIRHAWLTQIEVNLDAQVQPILFRLIANFLDQGISRWSVAREGESLWKCLWRLVYDSFIPLYPFGEPEAKALLSMTPDKAIETCLARIVGDEIFYGIYLLEMSLGHPGWSGMVSVIANNPESLLTRRQISLKEFLAVELVMELAVLNMKRGPNFPKVDSTPDIDKTASFAEALDQPAIPLPLRCWHEAMEFSLHAELIQGVKQKPQKKPDLNGTPAVAQAIFCIDDRECSLRRHLEEIEPGIKTYGAAGFFGIEFFYKGVDDLYPVAQCPVVITPKHLIIESTPGLTGHSKKSEPFGPASEAFKSKPLMRGWIFTQTIGLGYAVKLAWDVFKPGAKLVNVKKLGEVDSVTQLHLIRQNDEPGKDGRLLGFSYTEMADRLEGLLRNIGLTESFARIVVVVAHGSSSTNNPHFAAYDCGACAGKPGAPNARAFAQMANDENVRALLRDRGIDIPSETLFVASLHNTSRDEITYYDQHQWPEQLPEALPIFQAAMDTALRRNAQERCRWFELGPDSSDETAAMEHVRLRASSIFEPRPELNHSNNLYAVVGRRSLTTGLFLDRRAFLHSYDPNRDPAGEILARILSAVIPVCGGINLEYLFSRIDNSMYGAGTKLPHNVIGLLGVANGVEGDLRTGLPSQMIEVHEPSRLLILVEQDTTILNAALSRIEQFRPWLDNEWVRLASCHPVTKDVQFYSSSGWNLINLPKDFDTPTAVCSTEIYPGLTETIPVHILTGEAA